MPRETMIVVTQVAPYADGPAGVHGVLVQAGAALAELAEMAGLEPLHTSDVTVLDPAQIEAGRVLALFTIGCTPWSGAQRTAITRSFAEGRLAILSVHSATDASSDWEGYERLVGARFDGHPWTQSFDVEVVDDRHPATAHLPPRWPWHDEVYLFRDLREDARVLLRADPSFLDMDLPDARRPECGFPLSWCFTEEKGRSFYTALGHFSGAWETPQYLRHVQGGLSWVLDGGTG